MSAKLETLTVIAPAAWACSLVNDDSSSLTDAEERACCAWFSAQMAAVSVGYEVRSFWVTGDCGEPFAAVYEGKLTDVCSYTLAFERSPSVTPAVLSRSDLQTIAVALSVYVSHCDRRQDENFNARSSDKSYEANAHLSFVGDVYRTNAGAARKALASIHEVLNSGFGLKQGE